MRIFLFLTDKILTFSLPTDIEGSFSFDADLEEESKLINVEARNGEWVIYSVDEVRVVERGQSVDSTILRDNSFYVINRLKNNYLIYVSSITSNKIDTYKYDKNIKMVIGNGRDANVYYNCPYLDNLLVKIYNVDNRLVLEKNNLGVYVNDKILIDNKYFIKNGDSICIYGYKLMFLDNLLFQNNPGGNVKVFAERAGIVSYDLPDGEEIRDFVVKDRDLYLDTDYFSKAPRIRRIIETATIKLSPPPHKDSLEDLPFILTIGPMLTMGIMSLVTLIDLGNKLSQHQTSMADSWPQLVTASAMLLSMILWPVVTNIYNKKLKKKRRAELVLKYGKYLDEKKEELVVVRNLQRDILIENLITVDECLKIIRTKNMNFWDKRIDQNDFLTVRIGMGNELLDAKIEYPEEGFTIEEDELRKQADALAEEFKYIENVPVSYSFYDNKVTAIMGGNKAKSVAFMNNVILQLLTFYSYEDLKLVVFTNENNIDNFNYIRYLNHNFNNDKSFRFFSTNSDSAKNVAEYLEFELNNRLAVNNASNEKVPIKPHYFIIVDDYEMVKRFDFIKTLTEEDDNLGFSIVILEERLSKLPSKCNNFISLGVGSSGVLKNSYEKQEQIVFRDEVNYQIDMSKVGKMISSIPIEFEDGLRNLPDAISFLEMEKVGKVEQLNILNRWNINDATTSLRTEIGVDEAGDLMYLDLHEKYHGPHGLIAGTTGSGKSEFIITYILSMCINYSPDDVAFILIDYKGGGLALAFENKAMGVFLPHLAGTITNLDKASMARTLVSIDSEVKRRQMMFNEARDLLGESTMDIYKYQKFYNEGRLEEAIPHLFIICDEFAELKSQQPEFMDNLISVARIGRSLGVHLILATQKPSGVVNDQIWSNTRFRVCLKVSDEADSKEMLKRPEAASIKQAGRYYLQVGYDEYFALGQSAFCGAKYYPSEKIVKQVDKSINFIDDCGNFIKSIQASSGRRMDSHGEQLANILASIIECADKVDKRARRLWLEDIPSIITVEEVINKYGDNSSEGMEAILGIYDAPEQQKQGIVKYNYLTDGNTVIYGVDGSESEMLLGTMIYSTVTRYDAEDVNFYIIDYGSEALRRYEALPEVGGMVFAYEDEKYNNLLKMIREEVAARKKLFVNYGGEYQNYLRNSGKKLPLMVVIVNNYDSLYEAYPSCYDEFPDLVRDSNRYGVVFIFTANAINSIPNRIATNLTNIYTFKLKDPTDYQQVFGVRTKLVLNDDIVGRGLLFNGDVHEFQTASIVRNDDDASDYLIDFINKHLKENPVKARRIPTLPEVVDYSCVEGEISTLTRVPIGISKKELEIITYDYLSSGGNIIAANKIANTSLFIKSLLMVFRKIRNINLMVMDSTKELMLNLEEYPNYYNDNFSAVIDKIIEYIDKLVQQKSSLEGIILIYGLSKFILKVDDNSKVEELFNKLKSYEHIGVIVVDDSSKIKNYVYESWFTSFFSVSDGLWIGRGVSEQNLFPLSSVTREMMQDIKNNMGWYIQENMGILCKLIDFNQKGRKRDGE